MGKKEFFFAGWAICIFFGDLVFRSSHLLFSCQRFFLFWGHPLAKSYSLLPLFFFSISSLDVGIYPGRLIHILTIFCRLFFFLVLRL